MAMKTKDALAIELREALKGIDEAKIPVMSRDRSIRRKEQAKLARDFFKQLGLKGISVTTPNYSMAHHVEVSLPAEELTREDFLFEGRDYWNESFADMPAEVPAKAKRAEHWKSRLAVEEILARAFPKHDDRSDSLTDYFDFRWSVD